MLPSVVASVRINPSPLLCAPPHRLWETVYFKGTESSLTAQVPYFFNVSLCGHLPTASDSCKNSHVCFTKYFDEFYSLGSHDSCRYRYSERHVHFQFEYEGKAAERIGKGNVSVTLVCGRSLVSCCTSFVSLTPNCPSLHANGWWLPCAWTIYMYKVCEADFLCACSVVRAVDLHSWLLSGQVSVVSYNVRIWYAFVKVLVNFDCTAEQGCVVLSPL